ncbi:hypothetical protein LOC68_01545 [Blastopirellula sp. JC732]|uniref:TIGR04255 family protein n=1 Tax=Blastopirellula sediminis TaxID=2894196 RepID=A0A9X1MKD7_9BACT|nr:hypothetical protein [Blastopirellula sediminis]MCC9608128.1 hypothetical protein [Blastopirellula sediminis]MCC9627079.1 hypothetical protein [Blastopirellula sediminis]
MAGYRSLSDDCYVNMNLNTEMDLPSSRETVLHFFEQIRKKYPLMRNFYARERSEFVLEEDKDQGNYRWASVEAKRVLSGCVNIENLDDAIEQHRFVLDLVPYLLSVSPLDCESLNLMYGFDFTYRGNHNQLVAEALGLSPAFERLGRVGNHRMVSCEPSIQFALDDDCRMQCRISIETRTSAYHVRTGEFPEEQLSVYVTMRNYGSLDPGQSYVETLDALHAAASRIMDEYVIGNILEPLRQAITLR